MTRDALTTTLVDLYITSQKGTKAKQRISLLTKQTFARIRAQDLLRAMATQTKSSRSTSIDDVDDVIPTRGRRSRGGSFVFDDPQNSYANLRATAADGRIRQLQGLFSPEHFAHSDLLHKFFITLDTYWGISYMYDEVHGKEYPIKILFRYFCLS